MLAQCNLFNEHPIDLPTVVWETPDENLGGKNIDVRALQRKALALLENGYTLEAIGTMGTGLAEICPHNGTAYLSEAKRKIADINNPTKIRQWILSELP